jgi:acylphosphatase
MILRFIISGDNVQGIQLRETIAKEANHAGLQGQTRNLLTGEVETIFLCENNKDAIKNCINKSIGNIIESDLLDVDEIDSIRINDKKWHESEPEEILDEKTEERLKKTKFVLVREAELREMVWALQGAGKVFLSASLKVETLLGYKEKEVRGRLESVKRELLHMQNHIENVHEPVCIKQFIADPLIDLTAGKNEEEDLIRDLIEFYHDYVSYKKKGSRTQEAEKEYIERIKTLIEGINLQMERFNNKQQLNQNKENDTRRTA